VSVILLSLILLEIVAGGSEDVDGLSWRRRCCHLAVDRMPMDE
jgi:hypothetical protein